MTLERRWPRRRRPRRVAADYESAGPPAKAGSDGLADFEPTGAGCEPGSDAREGGVAAHGFGGVDAYAQPIWSLRGLGCAVEGRAQTGKSGRRQRQVSPAVRWMQRGEAWCARVQGL